jgi:hypothetical protein
MKQNPKINDDVNSDEDLLNQFRNATDKNEQVEILKELFDVKKLELITDLSPDHVALITRILMISDLKDIPKWKEGIVYFMKLRISNKRQSRKELIDAIKGINSQKNPMEKMKERFFG